MPNNRWKEVSTMQGEKVVILMGSRKDLEFASPMGRLLEEFGVDYEYRVASAHKTPRRVLKIIEEYEGSEDKIVYITVAGLSDALSGVVAGYAGRHPVIACPPDPERHDGAKVLSTLDTPVGVPVSLVLRPENAVLHALRIMSLGNPELSQKVLRYQRRMAEKVEGDDREIKNKRVSEL
ncbi:MAG: AIR carboxylase family protein [Candidatus Geothermarchaeales archaeon]